VPNIEIDLEAFFANDLRLMLIAAGVFIILGIYINGRRVKRKNGQSGLDLQSLEPGFSPLQKHDEDDFFMDEDVHVLDCEGDFESLTNEDDLVQFDRLHTKPARKEEYVVEDYVPPVPLPPGVEPLIICVNVISPKASKFRGVDVKASIESTSLVYGDMSIYHYYEQADPLDRKVRQKVFSIASATEPGYFDRSRLSSYETAGLTLFLQIPGPLDGVLAFERMCQVAKYFAGRLGGVFCDEKRNKMTLQAMANIKDEISAYNLKLRSLNRRSVH